VNVGLVLAENRLLPGQGCLDDTISRVLVGHRWVTLG
jgi:hypothetical protein